MADYWYDIRLPKDRIEVLKDAVLADFEGRHAQGEAEVTSQRKRLPGWNVSAPRLRVPTTTTR